MRLRQIRGKQGKRFSQNDFDLTIWEALRKHKSICWLRAITVSLIANAELPILACLWILIAHSFCIRWQKSVDLFIEGLKPKRNHWNYDPLNDRDAIKLAVITWASFLSHVCNTILILVARWLLLLLSVRRHQILTSGEARNWAVILKVSPRTPQFSLGVQIIRSGIGPNLVLQITVRLCWTISTMLGSDQMGATGKGYLTRTRPPTGRSGHRLRTDRGNTNTLMSKWSGSACSVWLQGCPKISRFSSRGPDSKKLN
jgi:hypothetical protein